MLAGARAAKSEQVPETHIGPSPVLPDVLAFARKTEIWKREPHIGRSLHPADAHLELARELKRPTQG
jgi:hypothetical protein